MKKHIVYLLVLFTLVFTSCDFSGESNYTPGIFFIQNPVNNKLDTLNSYYTSEPGVFIMDTISVGDTIRFFLRLEAYANKLTAFYLLHRPDSVAALILPDSVSMDTIFTVNSQYDKGIFLMEAKYGSLIFPFQYVALKPSLDARLEFAVVSDAIFDTGFGSNSHNFKLKTPIIPQ